MRALLVAVAVALFGAAALNGFYVTGPALLELREDPRNETVTMVPHLRYGVDPTVIVLDLVSLGSTASMADVDRVMFQIAHTLRTRSFTAAHLAYRGSTKFILSGADFQEIGRDYGSQNPIYTIRTLPEKLYRADGTRAFGTWTGGVFGVLTKQMEDHQAMHVDWYLRDVAQAR
ncbi:hypothetical protein CCR97_10170 [Rhodoplanes elegans]|uniref:Uncharacterized protein n=1 Tax=Rhodoplanes elegans TaxID=29408 RepID=A0A327KRG3_9BRAD|nr:hypothetical protein [Rhodoplanes elegans]MBK5958571.1 hypothetical protein [Rhodoplanes elegans]RAI40536.1 hypothetical protein CH338_05990 [Rhodoplanes elegans]